MGGGYPKDCEGLRDVLFEPGWELRSRLLIAGQMPNWLASWAGVRSPLAAANAALRLEGCPKYSPLPGHHPAADREPPAQDAPPYQGA